MERKDELLGYVVLVWFGLTISVAGYESKRGWNRGSGKPAFHDSFFRQGLHDFGMVLH